jgi:DNA adenine methylase
MAASSAIKRHGGKGYLAKKIRELFPEHTRYCETHFGSGAVLFAGDGMGVAEYVNDLDRELSNFWSILQNSDCFLSFLRLVQTTPFSQLEFEAAKTPLDEGEKYLGYGGWSVCRAAQFFVRNRQSRQALGKSFATPSSRLRRGMNENVSAWLSAVDGLPEIHARLRRVEIRCMDAVDFIRELDSPETLFYCDPPYVHGTREVTNAYQHEMTDEQHRELLYCLAGIEGKFLLSGYPNPIYNEIAEHHGWSYVDFEIDNKASAKKQKDKEVERIWANCYLRGGRSA